MAHPFHFSDIYQGILYGCHEMILKREAMNAINVFPVADGDTGDNLAKTAEAIIEESECLDSVDAMFQSLAMAALNGARGNSGMIFAQFINGLCIFNDDNIAYSLSYWVKQVNVAVQSVREAIYNPKEGTILTLMDVFAKKQSDCLSTVDTPDVFFSTVLPFLKQALDDTTHQLAILEAAHVVDAGALGFYHFVLGMHQYFTHYHPFDKKQPLPAIASVHVVHGNDVPLHRFCTEGLIEGDTVQLSVLKTLLSSFGDSIVVTGGEGRCRFHVHTNTPAVIFESIRSLGTVKKTKVEDMLRQFNRQHVLHKSVAIVTDSSCDLPDACLDAYDIDMVPLNIHIEGSDLLDRYGMTSAYFYSHLNQFESHPTTSCPSPKVIEQIVDPLAKAYETVILLPLSKTLSGTYLSFCQGTQSFPNASVMDTRLTSASLGLLAIETSDYIKSHALDDLLKVMPNWVKQSRFYIIVNQFDAMIRSGRVSKVMGKMAKWAGLKPVLTLNEEGEVVLLNRYFSMKKAIDSTLAMIVKSHQKQPIKRYAIVHANAVDIAEALGIHLTEALGFPPVFVGQTATVIGVHSGSDCLGIAVLHADEGEG
jgi:DegV family protein with EDD domain